MGAWKPQRGNNFPNFVSPLARGLIHDFSLRERHGERGDGAASPPAHTGVEVSSINTRCFWFDEANGGSDDGFQHWYPAGDDADFPAGAGGDGHDGHGGAFLHLPVGDDWHRTSQHTDYTDDTVAFHMGQPRTVIARFAPVVGGSSFRTLFQLPAFSSAGAALGSPFVCFLSTNGGWGEITWGIDALTGNESLDYAAGSANFGGLSGEFHHLALVYDGSGTTAMATTDWTVYVDGVDQSSTLATSGNIAVDTNRTSIGGDDVTTGSNPRSFRGSIDRIRVWNRQLTHTEVLREMALPYEIYRPAPAVGRPFLFFPLPAGSTINQIVGETVNVSEGTLELRNLVRLINETVNVSEALVTPRDLLRVINETVNLSEGVLTPRGIVRVLTEAVQISEGVLTLRSLLHILNETVQVSEDELTFLSLVRVLTESVQISEGVLTPRDLNRVVNETVNISEDPQLLRTLVRLINETVQVSEDPRVLRTLVRLINETVNISEDTLALITVVGSTIVTIVNETVNLSEGTVTPRTLVRVLGETVQLSEALVTARDLVRVLNETVQITDSLVAARDLVRVLGEVVQISEGTFIPQELVAIVNEVIQIGEDLVTDISQDTAELDADAVNVSEALVLHLEVLRMYSIRGITLE
jgi:hypothetical protein